MKVVILAGGFGTRISEESQFKPKPMIYINGKPILWHIMKSYSYYGFNEFIICCGYKAEVIKDYFHNYYMTNADVTYDFTQNNKMTVHNDKSENWIVTVVDTGLHTMTGGRIKRIKEYINNEPFMLTYGDGVCDVDLVKLLEFHRTHKKMATLTAIQPGGRFGMLDIKEDDHIENFAEKTLEAGGWINGGFMVLEPKVLEYIDDDSTVFEKAPLETIANQNQLVAYKHSGFWQCMDTLRDKLYLEELLLSNKAPWKKW